MWCNHSRPVVTHGNHSYFMYTEKQCQPVNVHCVSVILSYVIGVSVRGALHHVGCGACFIAIGVASSSAVLCCAVLVMTTFRLPQLRQAVRIPCTPESFV